MWNTAKTVFLLGLLSVAFVLIGDLWGGLEGAALMLVIAGVLNLGAWFFSDTIVLKTSGAQEIPDDPELNWIKEEVAELAQAADMPVPRVYWVPGERSPNAFATGRSPSKGVVAVTRGLLETLDRRQVRAVLAHELGHIKHRDTLTSAIAGTMAGAITFMARAMLYSRKKHPLMLVVALVAPLFAVMLRMAVSRSREYEADRRAASITEDPEGLAQALEVIAFNAQRKPMQTGNVSTHYLSSSAFGGGMVAKMFSTHPPTEERVKRLRALAQG
jgi:heat shock protein HtpX